MSTIVVFVCNFNFVFDATICSMIVTVFGTTIHSRIMSHKQCIR